MTFIIACFVYHIHNLDETWNVTRVWHTSDDLKIDAIVNLYKLDRMSSSNSIFTYKKILLVFLLQKKEGQQMY
jgi:hypothetical protein